MNVAAASATLSARVIVLAREAGFDLCGIAPPQACAELSRYSEWLERGYAGEMKYLHDPRRENPAHAMKGARSVIVVALNYNSAQPYSTHTAQTPGDDSPRGWISRYAWGEDYHHVLKQRLEALVAAMRCEFPQEFNARAYVDTGPIHERVAAQRAGLGWLAKNTLLINEQLGSWLFLGVIVTDLDLSFELAEPADSFDQPPADLCGNCRLCIDACPTGAIVEPYVLDARRCISYLTIELRGPIPEELRPQMGRMVYGCDICQDVCPWNHKAPVSTIPAFEPRAVPPASTPAEAATPQNTESLFAPLLETLAALSEEQYRELFRGSAMKRAKRRGIVRNACVALGNAKLQHGTPVHARVSELLTNLSECNDALIAEHARWALERINQK